jgi:hypothetical protein
VDPADDADGSGALALDEGDRAGEHDDDRLDDLGDLGHQVLETADGIDGVHGEDSSDCGPVVVDVLGRPGSTPTGC